MGVYITGHILFDGVDYESMSTMGYDIYDSKSIWENMQLKFQISTLEYKI